MSATAERPSEMSAEDPQTLELDVARTAHLPVPRAPLDLEQEAWFRALTEDPSAGAKGTRRPAARTVLALVAVLAVALAVVAVLVVVRSAPADAGASSASTASSATSSDAAGTGDPEEQLEALQDADAPAVERSVGSWLPLVSAKQAGMVVNGRVYDAAAVLADHERLRAQYPGALLAASEDWSSFKSDDFWVTLIDAPSATAAEANAWCDRARLGAYDCYAKRLSHTGGYAGNTAMR